MHVALYTLGILALIVLGVVALCYIAGAAVLLIILSSGNGYG